MLAEIYLRIGIAAWGERGHRYSVLSHLIWSKYIYTRQKKETRTVGIFYFLELDQIYSVILFILFCSKSHQFKPENSFDSIQIGISNHL